MSMKSVSHTEISVILALIMKATGSRVRTVILRKPVVVRKQRDAEAGMATFSATSYWAVNDPARSIPRNAWGLRRLSTVPVFNRCLLFSYRPLK
jgi:hypothetical protein